MSWWPDSLTVVAPPGSTITAPGPSGSCTAARSGLMSKWILPVPAVSQPRKSRCDWRIEPEPPAVAAPSVASIQPLVMLSKPNTPSIPGAMSTTSQRRSVHTRSTPWSVGTWTESIMNTGASREPPTPPTVSVRV